MNTDLGRLRARISLVIGKMLSSFVFQSRVNFKAPIL